MDKLKEKLSRLMYGRYGIDQLGNFMMWAAVAMMIFGAVVRSSLIYTLALVLVVWADVRIMSKNHSKRYAENQKFLELKNLISHVGMGKMQVCFWLCVFCIAEKLRCVEKALRRIELQKIHKPSDNDISK